MYGEYNLGELKLENDNFCLSIERDGDFYVYERVCKGDLMTKRIKGFGKIILNPVEPVNLPKNITSLIEIEFKEKVVVGPRSKLTIYVTFPIEIGVFVVSDSSLNVLDVFTLNSLKYTLYGTPGRGVICRYWLSDIYTSPPRLDCLREGIIELEISNSSDNWVEVGKTVLDVYSMKIYYDDSRVVSKAVMNVTSRGVAETQFLDGNYNMKKAIEIYVAKKLQVLKRSFVMEWGLC
ncbi:DUF432 domain-containing protein [Archaeoglobus profundus]|uniref:DUF432 domain-containing protein n=1 Tax=Archaeoglobus profundus (strain DSM 5631 / JCM 9629 / NBRC 100127 / Av18) TaxID=572546 RepID=D2RDV5_ARCPA|nr:DUF432 domain-containing protein [Archaeoglobus profundus]ADB58299.1 Protein of unknown function DUF432 [Archaeoglobus profundus DSM 5631]